MGQTKSILQSDQQETSNNNNYHSNALSESLFSLLPREIWRLCICPYLSHNDIIALRNTCRFLHNEIITTPIYDVIFRLDCINEIVTTYKKFRWNLKEINVVRISYSQSYVPHSLKKLLPTITCLQILNENVPDWELKYLSENLLSMIIETNMYTERALRNLPRSLRELTLNHFSCDLTSSYSNWKHLTKLTLGSCAITTLKYLPTSLLDLTLYNMPKDFDLPTKFSLNLTKLVCNRCKGITDKNLKYLPTTLVDLTLKHCEMNDHGLNEISSNIRKLHLSSASTFANLERFPPGLTVLSLEDCHRFDLRKLFLLPSYTRIYYVSHFSDMTPLSVLAYEGELKLIKELISKVGVDLNQANSRGKTALYFAVIARHVDVVKCLLDLGADQKRATKDGRTLISISCQERYTDILDQLLQNSTEDINKPRYDGISPLGISCLHNDLKSISLLITYGADINQSLFYKSAETRHEWWQVTPFYLWTFIDLPQTIRQVHKFSVDFKKNLDFAIANKDELRITFFETFIQDLQK